MLSRIAFALAAALLALGCGRAGTFEGEVAGNTLRVEDAVFFAAKDDAGNTAGALLIMADVPDFCGMFKAGHAPKNGTYVAFAVLQTQLSGADLAFLAPDRGSYQVVDPESIVSAQTVPRGRFALGGFVKNDANCQSVVDTASAVATSGTVGVEKIEFKKSGSMTGGFDVAFGSQNDGAKGTFNASFCDADFLSSLSCG